MTSFFRGINALAALAMVAPLAACDGDVKETLGLKRNSPDEFRVVSHPPLSVPPDFNLRPPSATAQGPASKSASSEAQSLLMGKDSSNAAMSLEEKQSMYTADTAVGVVTTGELNSPAEAQLLQKAGAEQAQPNIRDTIYEETMVEPEEDKGFFSSLWPDKKKKPEKEPVVDAAGEKSRIDTNKAEGKPVTEGETPVVEKSKGEGLLNELLGTGK